jgi:DNA-binding LacI/PurR family transcriptional regulator
MNKARNAKSRRVRQDVIVSYLRDPIVDGRLRPGERLPAQGEVVRRFGSSPLTVKRAYRQLERLGFTRAVAKVGTFVADHPPHACQYALILPDHEPSDIPHLWSRFHRALTVGAARINSRAASGGRRVRVYFDCGGHTDTEDYQRLMRDIGSHQLAGLMFGFTPHALLGSPLIEEVDLPRVALGDTEASIMAVSLDNAGWVDRALELLRARGRRRVAVITSPLPLFDFFKSFDIALRRHDMTTRPFWTQAVSPAQATLWARHAVHALLHEQRASRSDAPDALMITDDHLVEPVADALHAFRVRVPEDVAVVGHWNFPLKYRRPRVPIELLGWDACEVIERWMDAIDAQRNKTPMPRKSFLPLREGSQKSREGVLR